MKNLKLGILACGAVLVVIILSMDFLDMLKLDAANEIMILIGAALPTAMGVMGMTKPPFLLWQGVVSLVGFGLLAVKMRIWDVLPHIMDMPGLRLKLVPVAIVLGVVLSIMAIVKPENKAA